MSQRIFAVATQVFSRHRAGKLHARLALLIGEIAQRADGGNGNAADQQQHDGDIDRRDPHPKTGARGV